MIFAVDQAKGGVEPWAAADPRDKVSGRADLLARLLAARPLDIAVRRAFLETAGGYEQAQRRRERSRLRDEAVGMGQQRAIAPPDGRARGYVAPEQLRRVSNAYSVSSPPYEWPNSVCRSRSTGN